MMDERSLSALPPDLPVPVDDGAAAHLPGTRIPHVALAATDGSVVDLAAITGTVVVFGYPRTGRPGEPSLVADWDQIPGARGCTPEACAFRDHHADLRALGVEGVFGVSTQDTDYQKEAVERLHLPFEMLSDAELRLTRALRLPTFEARGATLVKRLTLVLRDGRVEHCFYPVFPTDTHAAEVVAWLRRQPQQQPPPAAIPSVV